MSKINPIRSMTIGGSIGGFGAGCTIVASQEAAIKSFLADSYKKAKTVSKEGTQLTPWQKTKDILKGTTNIINETPSKIKNFFYNENFKTHRRLLLGAIILGCICGLISSIAINSYDKK